MKKNWFTNIGAIIASVGAVPTILGSGHIGMPGWLYTICAFSQVVGPVIIGIGAADSSRVDKLDAK